MNIGIMICTARSWLTANVKVNIPEQGLFSAENLNGRSRMLGEIHEGTGVGDESRADQFSHQNREIRGDRHHPVLDVIVKLTSERQMAEPDNYKPQKHQIAVPVHSFLGGFTRIPKIFALGPIFWFLRGFQILAPWGTPKTLKSHISAIFYDKRTILVSIFLY